jgi:hypothetical protein
LWENFLFQFPLLLKFFRSKIIREKSSGTPAKAKGYAIQYDPLLTTARKTEHSKYYNFIAETFHDRFFYLDCTTDDEKMFQCTKKYLKQLDPVNDTIFFSFNMHPKGMTKDHYSALEKYHTKLKNYYQGNIAAISYQQAAEILLKTA